MWNQAALCNIYFLLRVFRDKATHLIILKLRIVIVNIMSSIHMAV